MMGMMMILWKLCRTGKAGDTVGVLQRLVSDALDRAHHLHHQGEDEDDEGGDLAQLGGIDLNTGCAGLRLQIQLGLRDITFLVLV